MVREQHRLYDFSFLKNWLRFVLWPRIWFLLVNIPFVLEKNVYSVVLGVEECPVMSVLFGWWYSVLFRPCWNSTYYLVDYWEKSIEVSNYNYLSFSPFSSVNFCFTYFKASWMCTYILRVVNVFLVNWCFYRYVMYL